jgi:23S rRNA (adenine2503-C2)-methyltransferase
MTVVEPVPAAPALPSIFRLSKGELAAVLTDLKQPAYRAGQILNQLYSFAPSFAAMTDLPQGLRQALAEKVSYPAPHIEGIQHDEAGATDKFLFSRADGAKIEAVAMGNRNRPPTLCVSSQVGCPLGCVFCATGLMGFKRNLTFEEVISQIWCLLGYLKRDKGMKASPNIVFMGMGEPLLNRRNLFDVLKALTDPERIGLGDRHITVSTIGIPDGIREFAHMGMGVNLALSLHHPHEEPRRALMPFARASLAEVMEALTEYATVTKRLVTFEYVMLSGVNDSVELAKAVARLMRDFKHPSLVNLIPFNAVSETPYVPSSKAQLSAFAETLKKAGIRTTIRRTQGQNIDAACGQLALKGFAGSLNKPMTVMR